LSEEAANITSFSLALAVCDALRPDIIWRELKFSKTIERNIFVGDFGERGKDVLKAIKPNTGFQIILGNPPFLEELTDPIKKDLSENNIIIPSQQLAYYVLIKCIKSYLAESGKMCMIQPSGFLYNLSAAQMRCDFAKNFGVEKILDFISINGLFHDANTKAIAILAQKKKPKDENIIMHLTFRRTIAVNKKICFELDYYDYHHVLQQEAINEKYAWKANLLGGGRLVQLAKHFSDMPTIQNYLTLMGWFAREGYIVGEKKTDINKARKRKVDLKSPDWLFGQPLLVSEAITSKGINKNCLDRVKDREFLYPRDEEIYHSPVMVIEERDTLNSCLWNEGFLAYTNEYIGIKAKPDNEMQLNSFYLWFKDNSTVLSSCLHLSSGRMLTVRATATQKKDILNLPYPNGDNFDLVPWEKELLDDIRNYMAEYVRIGQDSELLTKEASAQDIQNYSETFLRLMNKTYHNLKKCKEHKSNDFRLIAFSFSDVNNPLPELENSNWLETLASLVENKHSYTLQTQRVVRIYTGEILIIVKPNKLRYWIRSTAIRDVDDVMVDIIKGGK
jgi:hypothetical protein